MSSYNDGPYTRFITPVLISAGVLTGAISYHGPSTPALHRMSLTEFMKPSADKHLRITATGMDIAAAKTELALPRGYVTETFVLTDKQVFSTPVFSDLYGLGTVHIAKKSVPEPIPARIVKDHGGTLLTALHDESVGDWAGDFSGTPDEIAGIKRVVRKLAEKGDGASLFRIHCALAYRRPDCLEPLGIPGPRLDRDLIAAEIGKMQISPRALGGLRAGIRELLEEFEAGILDPEHRSRHGLLKDYIQDLHAWRAGIRKLEPVARRPSPKAVAQYSDPCSDWKAAVRPC